MKNNVFPINHKVKEIVYTKIVYKYDKITQFLFLGGCFGFVLGCGLTTILFLVLGK